MTASTDARHTVGTEIRVAMIRAGYTITTLASAIGMSRRTLNDKILGHRPFTIDEVAMIATVLDVDFHDLLPFD